MSKGTRITKRWIDADGIMRACYNSFLMTGNKAYSEIIALVEAVPAADVAEVKHGRWKNGKCSICEADEPYTESGFWIETPYCPNCGASMVNEDD